MTVKTFQVEGAQLLFRNFSGKEGQYNREGDCNFSVILDEKLAKEMEKDGWNVKWLEPREEGDAQTPHVQVSVNFNNRPPRVIMITSTGRTTLNADTVGMLDWVDIKIADLIVRGYDWDVNGKTGVKAYLQTLYITIEEDALERKYALIAEEDGDD